MLPCCSEPPIRMKLFSSFSLCAAWALAQTPEILFTPVASGFASPVEITHAGDGSGRLFIVEQNGIIRILKNGSLLPVPFLSLGSKTRARDECGLLGLAFPPGFATKQYFYVHYNNFAGTSSIIARYRVSATDPDAADPNSETIVLTQQQPYPNFFNHKGGQLRFGPDGFLYVALGDGGDAGDPGNFSQNRNTFLGKLLRIDTEGGTAPYAIPPTNPFVSNPAYKPEIWALGLRNPWKFSFDRGTGDLWLSDVGQNNNEEINFLPAGSPGGQNYGWKVLEGFDCYPAGAVCNPANYTPPIFQYTHAAGDRSIIGGHVYRGSRNPAMVGTYVYGDLVSARVWGLRRNGPAWENRLLANSGFAMSTFGEDEAGELYIAGYFSGGVFRLDPRPPAAAPTIQAPTSGLTVGVSAVTFQWTAVSGASGWSLTVDQAGSGARVFQGVLSGGNVLSTVINLPDGAYTFSVRGCNGGFSGVNCGPSASVAFNVSLTRPAAAPTITQPSNGASLNISTLQFAWSAVPNVNGYEVELIDVAAGGVPEVSTANYGNPPATSTIASVRSSPNYRLRVRACSSGCGPWSVPVDFSVTLPPVPSAPPTGLSCALQGGQTAICNWNGVSGADIYIVQGIQPTAGPGGGALTVASQRVSTTNATLTVPPGLARFIVAACNGNGCSNYSGAFDLTLPGPASSVPVLAGPVPGDTISGPTVTFSWNRIPGDDGSNTVYRLYVQDFSRAAPALDVLTKSNFWGAKFRAGGTRYDALVIANPGLPGQAQGPPAGFILRGSSPAAPTMVSPRHQSADVTLTVPPGNLQLGWTPIPAATLYEYWVSSPSQSGPLARGVTPGLQVQIPIAPSQAPYIGIVRACVTGNCIFGSDANWGPWSNAAGQTGVTSFLVGP